MSAQASGGAGGDDKKPNRASKCKTCGNRHEGACWPKCGTCGKPHQGLCRYANPASFVGFGNAGREPSQAELTARFNAQQAGHQAGYQQAYNEMRLSSMGPGMGPGMGGQVYGPVGSFVSPYAGQYGGYVGPVNPGWSYPVPGSFGQGYAGFPTPAFGQGNFGTFGTFGNVSQPTSNYAGNKQGAAEWHEIQKKVRGRRENRKSRRKGPSKDKKDEKGILATKDAGIEKPTSRRAREKAKKQASEEKKKKKEEESPHDPMTGKTDVELLRLLAEPDVESAVNVSANTVNDEQMEDVALAQENVINELSIVDAQSLIEEATGNPSGFQFPQDQARVEAMANSLAQFGQARLVGLSDTATANSTNIVWEAFQHDLLMEQNAGTAAGVPLPESADEEL